MATKTTLTPGTYTTEWNGVDAFINTQPVTVPEGTTHLAVRLNNNSATMPSITFNGVALTLQVTGDDTNARACAIYTLASPAVGTFDLVANSGGVSRSITPLIDIISGASAVGATASAGNFLANRSLTLTTGVGDLVLDILNSAQTATVGAGQTVDLLNTSNTSASNETATTTSTVMSWAHTGDFTSQAAIVFTDGGGTPTPSITPSDPVVDGVQATITTANLSGAITATIGGYSITTAGTLPNLTYTLDIASITANGPVSAPRIGESLTLSVTGDEGEATSTVDFDPAAGYAAITLAGTLANEADSLIDGMQTASGLTVAVGDIMYYPTADTTSIAATGALTTDSESFTLILIQGGSATTAGNAYAFTVTPEAVTPLEPPAVPGSESVVRSVVRSMSSNAVKSIYRG